MKRFEFTRGRRRFRGIDCSDLSAGLEKVGWSLDDAEQSTVFVGPESKAPVAHFYAHFEEGLYSFVFGIVEHRLVQVFLVYM